MPARWIIVPGKIIMTVIPKEPFNGATRKGVEAIRGALNEASKLTSTAIDVALKSHGETLVDIFHRSEHASEIDWVNYKKNRAQVRKSLIEAPIYLIGAATLVIFLTAVIIPLLETMQEATENSPPLGFLIGFTTLFMAIPFALTLKSLIKEHRLGYTGWFTSQMRYRHTSAWAISKGAVYAARLSRTEEDLIEVARVPFYEIQACAYADYEGLQIAHLYTKSGQSFVLAEPAGTTLNGATNLANHIWSLTKSNPGIEEKP
jgi:hypothetical protein